jgi:hypothetical protein
VYPGREEDGVYKVRPELAGWLRDHLQGPQKKAYGAIADVPWLLRCPIPLDPKDKVANVDVKSVIVSASTACTTKSQEDPDRKDDLDEYQNK